MLKKMNAVKSVFALGLSLSLVACGQAAQKPQQSSDSGKSGEAKTASQSSDKPSADKPSTDKKVTLKIGDTESATDIVNVTMKQFAKDVAEKTNGTVDVKVYPAGQLGGELEMVQQVGSGSMQGVITGATGDAALDGFYAPFAFKNEEQRDKALDAGIFKGIFDKFDKEHKTKYLGTLARSARNITSNKEISSPADLKGLKIRVPQIKPLIGGFKELGADVSPLAFPEVFQALQSGVVDAQENPVELIYNSKFYEVQKYLVLDHHTTAPFFVLLSQSFWDSLSDNQKKAVEECFKTSQESMKKTLAKDSDDFVKKMEQKGMKVVNPNIDEFRKAFYDGYTKKYLTEVWGADTVSKLDQIK